MLSRNKNRLRNIKAQMSVFIVIGLVLIIATGIIISLDRSISEEKAKDLPEIEGADLRKAVTNYVDACLKPIVLNGLEIMRLQGGYIDIPSNVSYDIINCRFSWIWDR